MVSHLDPPRTPQNNGVSEKRNRSLFNMVRSMVTHATLSINFWGYDLENDTYILNLVPIKKLMKTPLQIWKGTRPFLACIKVWCYESFVYNEALDKLKPGSGRCYFISYPKKIL